MINRDRLASGGIHLGASTTGRVNFGGTSSNKMELKDDLNNVKQRKTN